MRTAKIGPDVKLLHRGLSALIDELFTISLWSEMLIIILKNEEKKVLLTENTYSGLLKRS